MSEELDTEVEVQDTNDTSEDAPLGYTKTGRIRKPRTQAQIDSINKAREIWSKNRTPRIKEREEHKLEELKKSVEEMEKRVVEKKCKTAIARYEKQKAKVEARNSKMKKDVIDEYEQIPNDQKVPEPEPVPLPAVPDPEPEPERAVSPPPKIIRQRAVRKKPVVVVEQSEDDTDLESNDPQVIFVKKKSKPKPKEVVPEPVPPIDPRFVRPNTNPFGRNYFYNPNSMQ